MLNSTAGFGQKRKLAQLNVHLEEANLDVLKILALVFIIFIGIPNQIIDYKHRKRVI